MKKKFLAALKIIKSQNNKKNKKSLTLSGFAGERKVAGGIENYKRPEQ